MTDIRVLEYGSCDYLAMVALREKILRKPLGLRFSDDDLHRDLNDLLIGCFHEDVLIACCILSPLTNGSVRLRQMAVDDTAQGKGIGSRVLAFAETIARENGFTELLLHARETAVSFYSRQGYISRGAPFEEVSIPHREMFKRL